MNSKMELSEENLTQIIKDALSHYKDKEFGWAKYVPMGDGFGVQFFDGPLEAAVAEEAPRRKSDDDDEPPTSSLLNPLNPLSPISILGGGGFGGFGGGSSGGGGASGGW